MKLHVTLFLLLIAGAVASLAVGAVVLPPAELWNGLWGKGDASFIMREIRLPRTLLAILVGGALGLSGAVMQGYLRNPLAEPGLLGVSGGASLGAVLAFYSGLSGVASYTLPLCGMVGALLAALLVWLLSGKQKDSARMILAGVAISSLTGAFVSVVLNLSPNPFAVMEIIFWLLGSLADRSMDEVMLILPSLCLGGILLLSTARALDALSLGETTAESLGVSLRLLQWRVMLGTALMVGAVVSVSGVIGFLGLIVPHLVRPFVGFMPGRTLIASALAGAVLLLVSDILVRVIPTSGTELKLGVITALLGAPFFLWLIMRYRREGI